MNVLDEIVIFARARRTAHIVVDLQVYTRLALYQRAKKADFSTTQAMIECGAFAQVAGVVLYYEGDAQAPLRPRLGVPNPQTPSSRV